MLRRDTRLQDGQVGEIKFPFPPLAGFVQYSEAEHEILDSISR